MRPAKKFFLLHLCYIRHRFRMIKTTMNFPRGWFTGSYIQNYGLFHQPTQQKYRQHTCSLPELTWTLSNTYSEITAYQRDHWSILAKRPLILVLVSARTFRDSYLMCFSYLFPTNKFISLNTRKMITKMAQTRAAMKKKRFAEHVPSNSTIPIRLKKAHQLPPQQIFSYRHFQQEQKNKLITRNFRRFFCVYSKYKKWHEVITNSQNVFESLEIRIRVHLFCVLENTT